MGKESFDRRAICERYAKLYTGAVADFLDEKGFRNQVLGRDLRPILPQRRAAGFAFPALGEQTDDLTHDCRPDILKFLEPVPPDSMIALNPGKEMTCAHWGEFMSLAARNKGCREVVVDGGVRDTELIVRSGFQVFHAFFWPVSAVGRWRPFYYGRPVVIHGIEIRPGDPILGVIDGVVVVPQPLIEEVLQAAPGGEEHEGGASGGEDPGGSLQQIRKVVRTV